MQRNMKGAAIKAVALTVGAGVLSSLALAGPAHAAPPAAGVNCVAADGKITGRGATFQANAQAALVAGYTADVCGPVASDAQAGTNMIRYNWTGAGTGSGAGIRALNCRTDAFAGSDVPYTLADMSDDLTTPFAPTVGLRGPVPPASGTYAAAGQPTPGTPNNLSPAVGGAPNNEPCTANQGLVPPFQPSPAPFPAALDTRGGNGTNGNFVAFPIAGASVAVGANLSCAAAAGGINLSTSEVSRLFGGTAGGGEITNWNQVNDLTDLSTCSIPVRRVVRSDASGTTGIFKTFLRNARPADALCQVPPPTGVATNNWQGYLDANQSWPQGVDCSPLITGNGNAGVVSGVAAVDGSVGYADISDWSAFPAAKLAGVANTAGVAVSPGTPGASNCNLQNISLPPTGPAGAVGTNANPTLTWASNSVANGGRAYSDVTFTGDGYPICGMTHMMTWAGLSGGAGAINRLTANQRRTLYSYMIYLTSPAAQSRLATAGYNAIGQSRLNTIRAGLQLPAANGF